MGGNHRTRNLEELKPSGGFGLWMPTDSGTVTQGLLPLCLQATVGGGHSLLSPKNAFYLWKILPYLRLFLDDCGPPDHTYTHTSMILLMGVTALGPENLSPHCSISPSPVTAINSSVHHPSVDMLHPLAFLKGKTTLSGLWAFFFH